MSGGVGVPAVPRLLVVALVCGTMIVGGCSARSAMNDQQSDKNPAAQPLIHETDSRTGEPGEPDVELGPTNEDEIAMFTLSLVLPGEQQMRAFLEALYDPRSPEYRQFLDANSFGARFGLPLDKIDGVVSWLGENGLEVVTRPPQRTSISVRGRVADVNRLFEITLVDWQTSKGYRYHRPVSEPRVPAALAGRVAWVVGLDTEPVVRPALAGIYAAGVPHGGLRPEDVRRAYEIEELHAAGMHGEGQTVAIVSLDTFNPDDIAAWDREMGITAPPVESIRIGGAGATPGRDVSEVSLDIEVIRGIAPAAQILNYEAPDELANFGPLIAQIVADGRADLVNISYGWCEKYYPAGVIDANEQEFAAAVAAGISIFVASGDEGAYGCRRVQINPADQFERDLGPAVSSPATSPNVISVGGTFLTVREDGTYFEEAGWEEPLGGSGAGGGLSTIYARPAWQRGAGVDNAQSNGMRQVPDVAGPADSHSGFIIIYTPPDKEQTKSTFGGTSAAAPFWVGSMALVRQLAGQRGVNGLGVLAPLLYQVAGERPDVFHDVVKGGNLFHEATAGWDYATGLGTPRVGPLAQAIVDFLTR
jgi:subtilase family serine protease